MPAQQRPLREWNETFWMVVVVVELVMVIGYTQIAWNWGNFTFSIFSALHAIYPSLIHMHTIVHCDGSWVLSKKFRENTQNLKINKKFVKTNKI